MQLTLFTRHALSVLAHLSRTPQQQITIAEIARAYDVSHNHLMKVVSELNKAGFIEAVRGRSGGIRLARPPREITLGDVVRHTEAGMMLAVNDPQPSGLDRLAVVLSQAFTSFLATLDHATLDDIAGDQDTTHPD